MLYVQIAGDIAAALTVAAYGWHAVTGRAKWFHVANAAGGPFIAAGEVLTRDWPPLVLTVLFTVISFVALVMGELRDA